MSLVRTVMNFQHLQTACYNDYMKYGFMLTTIKITDQNYLLCSIVNPIFFPKIRSIGGNSGLRYKRILRIVRFLIHLHYFRLKVAPQNDDICTSERHQVNARFLEESLRTFHLFADRFRALEMGYTGIRDTAGRREEGREGRKCCTGAAKRGGQCCRAGGSARRYPPASGRRLCIYACFATIACFLPITGSPSVP